MLNKRKSDSCTSKIISLSSPAVFFLAGIIFYWDFVGTTLVQLRLFSLHDPITKIAMRYDSSTQIKSCNQNSRTYNVNGLCHIFSLRMVCTKNNFFLRMDVEWFKNGQTMVVMQIVY